MFNKPDKNIEKPKEFNVSTFDLSELSFLSMFQRAKQEELAYYQERMRMLQADIEQKLGINPDWEVDWGRVFATGKIFARKPQPKPEIKVEVKTENISAEGQNAEPELQSQQEQGVSDTPQK